MNSGYETYTGGKEYYSATFSPNGVFIQSSYQTMGSGDNYSYLHTYVSHYRPNYGGSYQYGYNPVQTMKSTQKIYTDDVGASDHIHTVNDSSTSYFNGSYEGFYSSRYDVTYEGHTVPEDSSFYTLRTYQDSYGYTSYTSAHS